MGPMGLTVKCPHSLFLHLPSWYTHFHGPRFKFQHLQLSMTLWHLWEFPGFADGASCDTVTRRDGVWSELNLRSKTRLINERDEARDVVLLSPLRSCRASGPLNIHPHRTQEIAFALLNLTKHLPKRIIRHMCLAWLCLPHPLSLRRLQWPLTRPDMLAVTLL